MAISQIKRGKKQVYVGYQMSWHDVVSKLSILPDFFLHFSFINTAVGFSTVSFHTGLEGKANEIFCLGGIIIREKL